MAMPGQSCLRLRRGPTDSVLVTLAADDYEPKWSGVLDLVALTIFAGRDVCFVGYEPADWDVDFAELSRRRATIHHGAIQYMLAFAEQVTASQVLAAVRSTDFTLGLLFIAAIPEVPVERSAAFVAALYRRGQALAEAIKRETGARLVAALASAEADVADASAEECLYCEGDGERLVWCHPDAAALQRLTMALGMVAAEYGWRFESDLTPGR